MKLAAELKAINAALDTYRQQLDEIPDDVFAETPAIGGWSFAEVYSHIMQASLGSSVAAEKCCNKTGSTTTEGLNWKGMLVFLLGRFPPGKRKAPPAVAELTKNITKEEARNLIIKVRKRLESVVPLTQHAPDNNKISHPGLGMLNAGQWIKFLRIHLEHHLAQLSRIRKSFPQE
ncbi:DinB family protein [Mucilaginibacter sp. PAMB04168]|uniref:DinB family protein n=1 Tax=Mucilaginibacter sp. PAMB04168 TaxID=3138567 RepID=UPI0031F64E76